MKTLAELIARDKDKIGSMVRGRNATVIDPETMFLAEFGMFYGWGAIRDVLADGDSEFRISFAQMQNLVRAARKIERINRSAIITDSYTATVASQSKKGFASLKKLLDGLKD